MVKVNNGATPTATSDEILVQLDYSATPTPLDRLPKGIYYSFKSKWNNIVPIISNDIKKLINATGLAWGSLYGDINAQTDLTNKIATDVAKTKEDFSQTFLLMGA